MTRQKIRTRLPCVLWVESKQMLLPVANESDANEMKAPPCCQGLPTQEVASLFQSKSFWLDCRSLSSSTGFAEREELKTFSQVT